MRKRDRDCFEANTSTYIFSGEERKRHDPYIPQPLCQTALALVQNPQRLANYVNQLSKEYMLLFINDTIPLTAMTLVLKNNRYFWYLLFQRVARETGYQAETEYQTLIKQII